MRSTARTSGFERSPPRTPPSTSSHTTRTPASASPSGNSSIPPGMRWRRDHLRDERAYQPPDRGGFFLRVGPAQPSALELSRSVCTEASAGDSGAARTYLMVRELLTGRAVNELEIVASEPPSEFVIRSAGPTPFLYRYRFSTDDHQTIVQLGAEVARRAVKKGVDDNFAALKDCSRHAPLRLPRERSRSGTPREPCVDLRVRHGPLPQEPPRTVELIGREVDHRRRSARQLPPVEHQVHARAHALVDVRDAAGIRLARAVRARLEHRPADGRERRELTLELRDAQTQALGRGTAGERIPMRGVQQHERERPGEQPLDRRPGALTHLRQRGERRAELEEHHGGRRVGRASLQAVEPIHALARLRLGRESVDRVGGEDRHAPDRDAPFEGFDVLRRHGARPTVIRSQSARSGYDTASSSISRTASAWSSACSSATSVPESSDATSSRIASRPSAPPVSATRGS